MSRACVVTLLLACVSLSGCQGCNSPPIEPHTVSFDERWPTALPPVTDLVASLRGGTLSWTDPSFDNSGTSCAFVADAQYGNRDVDLFGQSSGQYNFRFHWTGLVLYPNLTDGCAGGMAPTEIEIVSGQNLTLGQTFTNGTLTITFGNVVFTSDYHEVALSRVNHQTRYISGQFKAIATNHADQNDTRVLVINNGFFGAPH